MCNKSLGRRIRRSLRLRPEITATGAWRFRLAFVPAGAHTLAFTCAADDDDAELDDAITFSAPIDVTVVPGQANTVNFPAP